MVLHIFRIFSGAYSPNPAERIVEPIDPHTFIVFMAVISAICVGSLVWIAWSHFRHGVGADDFFGSAPSVPPFGIGDSVQWDASSLARFCDDEDEVQLSEWREWQKACHLEGREIPPKEFKAAYRKLNQQEDLHG